MVGVADKHRFIAEINGVRFELFRNYGLQTSGSVKSVYLAIHSLLIDSRYYPEVFFNAGVDGSYQNPIDLDDVVIRLMIEREDGSVSEARITNATNQDATLSESAVDRYVSKLVSTASSPSITHVDYIGSTDTAQQPEPFTLNAHGDYQAAPVSANEGWANWNAFQPHNILHTDIYCNAFSAVSRYYDGSLLVPNGAASDAEIIIDYNPETIESRPCTTDVVRFFKTTQNSTWVEEQNDFASLSVLYNTTTSVKQINPR